MTGICLGKINNTLPKRSLLSLCTALWSIRDSVVSFPIHFDSPRASLSAKSNRLVFEKLQRLLRWNVERDLSSERDNEEPRLGS